MSVSNDRYRGRFAPSPTGPLHLGSLLTAVASFVHARHAGGEWLVRMEDLDRPRCRQAHADDILSPLERFGLWWDGDVLYQSRRDDAYSTALAAIEDLGLIYACTCRRRDLAVAAADAQDGPPYPGTCREASRSRSGHHALRVQTDEARVAFADEAQGYITQSIARDVGDFVLRRADGLYAYQLAVVVDDAFQAITHVVRGSDLLSSTPRQIYLQRLLGLPTPGYLHVPLLVDDRGEKISKQNHAEAIGDGRVGHTLATCLRLLGQSPPADLAAETGENVLDWAVEHWNAQRIPRAGRLRLGSPAG